MVQARRSILHLFDAHKQYLPHFQMLGGALVPGKPVANMYFDMYGYGSVVQALALLSDLKLVCSYGV